MQSFTMNVVLKKVDWLGLIQWLRFVPLSKRDEAILVNIQIFSNRWTKCIVLEGHGNFVSSQGWVFFFLSLFLRSSPVKKKNISFF